MNKGLSNFQIDDFLTMKKMKILKKLYGHIFNRFYNKIYKFL